jgi:hypothetical protein
LSLTYNSTFSSKNRRIYIFLGLTQPFGGGTATAPAQTAVPTTNVLRPDDLLITSLTAPRLFNDERDVLILKWNILQAFYGTGKTFCHLGKYNNYIK